MLIITVAAFKTMWIDWRQTLFHVNRRHFILLAIDVPRDNEQSPKAVENIFSHLYGILLSRNNLYEEYWEGRHQDYFSMELVSIEGYVQFLVYTMEEYRDIVESAFYSQYPNAEITQVEDYVYDGAPLVAFMVTIKATAFTDAVLVEWESLSELNTLGYHVERALSPDGPWTQLNGSMIHSQGSVMGASYDFVVTDVEQGVVYYYRLVSLDNGGAPTYYDPIKVTVPTIGEPYEPYVPPSPASVHRVFLPMVGK